MPLSLPNNDDHHTRMRPRSSRRSAFFITTLVLASILFYAEWLFGMRPRPLYNISAFRNPPSANPQNIALLIESRQSEIDNLAPLLLHFAAVLGPEWPIHILTLPDGKPPPGVIIEHAIEIGQIVVQHLPYNITLDSRDSVSDLLTSRWLWESLAPAPHVLIFQADSILCANSPVRIEEFLEYSFIGAPIDLELGLGNEGMNGGLSLRNRTMMRDIVTEFSFKDELDNLGWTSDPKEKYEDQWFYTKMKGRPDANLPIPDVAKTFAVESIWYPTPLGFHQVGEGNRRWQNDHVEEIEKYCPENLLASKTKSFIVGLPSD